MSGVWTTMLVILHCSVWLKHTAVILLACELSWTLWTQIKIFPHLNYLRSLSIQEVSFVETQSSASEDFYLLGETLCRSWASLQVACHKVTGARTDTLPANRFRNEHLLTVASCNRASWQVRIMMQISPRLSVGVCQTFYLWICCICATVQHL